MSVRRDLPRPPEPSRLRARGELERAEDLATARALLRAYQPWSAEQAEVRARILAFVDEHQDAAWRTCAPGHLTASALVVGADGRTNLLTHHRKLRRWLQLGGHCDGDTNFANVALTEAVEESGIADLRIDPTIVDVDIHTIPARPARPATPSSAARAAEPEHLHLDVRFVVWAPAGAHAIASAESLELAWVSWDELDRIDTDDSVRRIARRLLGPSR